MDNLLAIIGAGITTFLSSITPRSWFQRVNYQAEGTPDESMSTLKDRLRQSELRNQQLEARIAELERKLEA